MAAIRRILVPDASLRPAAPEAAPSAAAPFRARPPLDALVEALGVTGPSRDYVARTFAHRLGDARTLALLEAADVAECARLLREAFVGRNLDALRLGRILIAQRHLGPHALAAALKIQKSSGRRVGEELVHQRKLDARAVAHALWLQHKLVGTVRFLSQRRPGGGVSSR
jgi:hypothetical protein